MRLIDADKFIEYLGLDAENAREDNLGALVTMEDIDSQPSVAVTERPEEILNMARNYIALVKRLSGAVDKCRLKIRITDIEGFEMLSEFEKIIQELQEKGYCKEEGSND